MASYRKNEFVTAQAHAKLSTGEVIQMLTGHLKTGLKPNLRSVPASALRISVFWRTECRYWKSVGAEQLAKAFDVHPATIMFPEYESIEIKRAA